MPFFRRGLVPDAARTACIGNAAIVDDGGVMHDRRIHIGVVNDGRIHAHHSRVVSEVATAPFASRKADAHVAESIVDAAVVADVGSPVAVVEEIVPTFKAPVGRRPEETWLGSRHPGAGNPVIAVLAVSPVAGGPEIAVLWAERLLVNGQHGRGDTDADNHAGERRCRNDAEQQR
jgi:hypothetical protein